MAADVCAAPALVLQAGAARVNLTPPPEMKAALGGYGARESKPAEGVHDAVWAKSLVLSGGDRNFVIVTADVLAFPPGFKAAVMNRLGGAGWQADQVLLLPSHAHTSIDMMALHPRNTFGNAKAGMFQKELFELTVHRIAQVVLEANRKTARVRVGSVTELVPERNRNRRHGGPVHDSDLTVTRVDRDDGVPLAVLVNWTAHPTFMDAQDMLFSGDWPGHLQRTLEALIGHEATVLYYNGAEGDQSPTPPAAGASNWERAERYGREMGIVAFRAWENLQPREVSQFQYHTEVIPLPKRQPHAEFMKTGGAEYGLNEAGMTVFLEQLVPATTHSTCLRLGELLILGVPGEMAAQLGIEAKSRARELTGAHSVTIGGLADEWIGYILPTTEYRAGGYEASMSFYGEMLGDTLVTGVVHSAQGLK